MKDKDEEEESKGGIVRVLLAIVSYYTMSVTIILTSKWMLSPPKLRAPHARELFPFPLILTTCSSVVCTVLALLLTRCTQRFRVAQPLTQRQLLWLVLPVGVVKAIDLGASNIALKLLDVSFSTIIKGMAPVFTVCWGLLFRIEHFQRNVFASLLIISCGVTIATLGEVSTASFLPYAFALQCFATALAGLRWALTQIMLKGNESSSNLSPIAVILYASPATALFLAPVAFLKEGSQAFVHVMELSSYESRLLLTLILTIGTLVFVLLMSEYWLVQITSSLALSVCLVFKELLTIGGGIYLFQENLSLLNSIGFFISQLGIASYAWLRYQKDDAAARASQGFRADDDDAEEDVRLLFGAEDEDRIWDSQMSPLPQSKAVRILN